MSMECTWNLFILYVYVIQITPSFALHTLPDSTEQRTFKLFHVTVNKTLCSCFSMDITSVCERLLPIMWVVAEKGDV